MRVLVTGHTGFKGSWLTLLLMANNAEVGGLSLAPRPMSLFTRSDLGALVPYNRFVDIRELDAVQSAMSDFRPSVVIHLAAQALVLDGVAKPHETVDVNVRGTLNVLEAARFTPSIEQVLLVSTDKVYRNDGRLTGYSEDACLGGNDPYSASKAAADLVAQAWATTFDFPQLSICRAGNVIGGGDDSGHRLLPDVIRSLAKNEPISLRSPNSIRPWQHVLDCLNGYVCLLERRSELAPVEVFNFGPSPDALWTVEEVASIASREWGTLSGEIHFSRSAESRHEADTLSLNAEKAFARLAWQPLFDVPAAVRATVEWEKACLGGATPFESSQGQVVDFLRHVSRREDA